MSGSLSFSLPSLALPPRISFISPLTRSLLLPLSSPSMDTDTGMATVGWLLPLGAGAWVASSMLYLSITHTLSPLSHALSPHI